MVPALRFLLVATLVLLLELACRAGWVSPTSVIPPSAMLKGMIAMLQSGAATTDLVATIGRVAAAGLIAAAAGLALGLLLHAIPRLRTALEPVLSAWYAIPTIMFYPLLLVLFGVGAGAIVATAVLLAVVAMIASTLAGLDRVPPVLLRTGRALRLTPLETALKIRLPSAAPYAPITWQPPAQPLSVNSPRVFNSANWASSLASAPEPGRRPSPSEKLTS